MVTTEQRFWAKVSKTPTCWLWTASKRNKGYGAFAYTRDGKMIQDRAHRYSWEIHRGSIPEGLCVLHNCPGGDNPACVNPAHLFLGTKAVNNADMVAKGRHVPALTYLPNPGQGGSLERPAWPLGFWDALGMSKTGGNDKVAFLASYFDESYQTRRGALVIAAYVSTIERWALFADDWKRCLEMYRLPYFHMKEFRNGNSRMFRHLSIKQRQELFATLIGLIHNYVQFGASARINVSDYDDITQPEFRNIYGSAYALCSETCLGMIKTILKQQDDDSHTLAVIFERGHEHTQEVLDHLRYAASQEKAEDDYVFPEGPIPTVVTGEVEARRITFGEIGDATKRTTRPLHAADILAHTMLRARIDRVAEATLDTLTSKAIHFSVDMDKYMLRFLVEGVTRDAEERKRIGRELHIADKTIGLGGWRLDIVPGGFVIDPRNEKPLDIKKILADNPDIENIPPAEGSPEDSGTLVRRVDRPGLTPGIITLKYARRGTSNPR